MSPSGREITIAAESIRGGARLVRGPMLTKVEGWAAARGSDQPPDAILLFIDGRFVHATTTGRVPMLRRIAEDEALRKSGFQILLPWNATESGSDLRVYAVLEDVAAEIRLRR